MTVDLISRVAVFKHLRVSQIETIASRAKEVAKNRNDPIIIAGEKMIGLFVVARGTAGVYPRNQKTPVAILHEGEVIGETVLIKDHAASVTIRAEQDGTQFIFLPKAAFETFFKADISLSAGLYLGIAETLSERLRASNEKLRQVVEAKGDEFLALPSPEQILQRTAEALSTGRTGVRVDTSLATGIVDSLTSLAEQVPQHAETLKSIAYDVNLLREREKVGIAALSTHVTEMRDFIVKVLQAADGGT